MPILPPAVFLMGPTASGKTDLAVALVKRLPFEIISVDSAMVYRGMDIGTAKPDPATLARAPHRLLDICDPLEAYSAAQFCQDARREMLEIGAAGRIPLLVGGTGLYFRALQQGLAELPAADPAVRAELNQAAERLGWAALHQRLRQLDPETAARVHPNDPQRIQRALEVCVLSGQPMSRLLARPNPAQLPYRISKLILAPEQREDLRERIAWRFDTMLEQGLLKEVATLHKRGDLHLGLPSMRAVGYRQVWQYLDAELDFSGMRDQAVVATRQLAKRQLTWLRRETEAHWVDSHAKNILDMALKYLASVHIV